MKNLILIIALFFSFISINAQSNETKEKLKNLKGNVVKITIETEDGKVELTGDDAEEVMKKIKPYKTIVIKEESTGDKVSLSSDDDDVSISIDFDEKDGEQIIKIEKEINGEKTVDVYSSDEIEDLINEFLNDINININFDGDFHFTSDDEDEEGIEKEVNVEINNGVKKITTTTIKNGNKNVEVYEGEAAEKFLDEMEKSGEITVHISDRNGNKKIKKKIIIIEEDDDEE